MSVLLGFSVLAAGSAEAKFALERAEVCGESGCAVRAAEGVGGRNPHASSGSLPFELLNPTIEAGRTVRPATPPSGPKFIITLTSQPAPGDEEVRLAYFPDAGRAGFVRVLAPPGAEAAGASLNAGWVGLTSAERGAYDDLTSGVRPYGAAARTADASSAAIPAVIALALALPAALATAIALRRRLDREQAPRHGPTGRARNRASADRPDALRG